MGISSKSAYIAELVEQADAAFSRRRPLSWPTVESALRWYFENSSNVEVGAIPLPNDRYGCTIDSSRSMGNIRDEILSTRATISRTLDRMRVDDPKGHDIILRSYLLHETQQETAKRYKVDQSTISRWLGKAEASMIPTFREGGILNW